MNATHEYRPEPRLEARIYHPRAGMHPNALHQKYVGKPVHVRWQSPIFSLSGGGGSAGPLHEITRWYGYVVELDKQIPSEDLLPVPTNKPKETI